MRFPHLPPGARFEFEGKTYVKTGPVSATAEDGSQRMIPRYAVLKPLDGAPPPSSRPARQWDEGRVLRALETYHSTCTALLAGDPQALAALLEAKQAFLDSLAAE